MRRALKISMFVFISGCAVSEGPPPDIIIPLDFNLIFPNAFTIDVISPNQGDTLDTIFPQFSWDAELKADSIFFGTIPTSEMYYIGIFKENISSTGSEISNIEDNIWGWHSGLGKGRIGSVSFDDGLDVVNGQLQLNNQPTPLMPNTSYAYAIWAWDDEGNIIGSSREIVFVTGN